MPQFLPYQNASFVSTELRTLVTNGEAKRIWVLSLDVLNVDWQLSWMILNHNQDVLKISEAIWRLRCWRPKKNGHPIKLSLTQTRGQWPKGTRRPRSHLATFLPSTSSCIQLHTHVKSGNPLPISNIKHGCHGCHGCHGQISSVAPPGLLTALRWSMRNPKSFYLPWSLDAEQLLRFRSRMVMDCMGMSGLESNLETQSSCINWEVILVPWKKWCDDMRSESLS